MPIYGLRVTGGQEFNVALNIFNKCEKEGINIYSITVIPESKGIIYIEGPDLDTVSKACTGIQHTKALIKFPQVKASELEKFIKGETQKIEINVGDVVEIIKGALKNEVAEVMKINEEKGEVTVRPLNTFLNVPVTLPINYIRKKV